MNYSNLLKIAFISLLKNKLRTLLTMLGIIIGVGSVIAMLAVGTGSKENIQKQISSLGTNVIIIFPGSRMQGGARTDAGSSQRLTLNDARAIAEKCLSVAAVSPVIQQRVQAVAGPLNAPTSVMGVYPDYMTIRNLALEAGEIFSASDDRSAAKVCLVGKTVVKNLFGENADGIGQTIRLNKTPFKIIGVLEPKGQNTFGQDQDDIVIAPFSTVRKRMTAATQTGLQQILASALDENSVNQASDEITELLRQRHKIRPGDDDDFSVRTQAEFASVMGSTTQTMSILLAAIAGISLLVGGIGIMNIMLVSVTERTREIGIRRAIGARKNDVLLQFLIESVVISLLGGIIGILLGFSISMIVNKIFNWPVSVTPDAVLLSFLFSISIGIFFGWYPSRKAANLNPIEALRYE